MAGTRQTKAQAAQQAAQAADTASTPRRAPVQQRSRERMALILDVAKTLIAQHGSEHMKMSEVATGAGISIGSLYQYFPDKQAIVRTLAEGYAADSRQCIAAALETVHDLPSLLAAFASLMDQYHEICLAEPVIRDIWSATQADKQLVALELVESRLCGAMLAAAMKRVHPKADAKRLDTLAFLAWQLGEATMRLALSHSRKEGTLLVEAYKRMTLRALAEP